MKTVITMTSWTKRIQYVAKAIYRFLKTQTVKPDIFYLWLAEDEFPNKEKDLPEDLLTICSAFTVQIRWTKYNEYAFKRWHVYPKHNDDLVISIDDDMVYFNTLIEDCIKEYQSNPTPHIIHYSSCGGKIEIQNGISYIITQQYKGPDIKNYFFGQCCFTPRSFPLECITEEAAKLKREICPKTDEGWIHPFTIKNNIPIVFLSAKFRAENLEIQNVALRNDLHFNLVEINGKKYKKADIFRYLVINSNEELKSAWIKAFPNYNLNEFNKDKEFLLKVCL